MYSACLTVNEFRVITCSAENSFKEQFYIEHNEELSATNLVGSKHLILISVKLLE